MNIQYEIVPTFDAHDYIDVLKRSTLAERRPVDDVDRMRRMLENTDVIAVARDGARVVGVARAITDYAYCSYLADLAVDSGYQRRGIGRELMALVQRHLGDEVMLLLLSAPAAHSYYPHVGFDKVENAWMRQRKR